MDDDPVQQMTEQWRRERPDLDPEPMALFARLTRCHLAATAAIESTLSTFDLNRGEFDLLASLRRFGPPYRLSPGRLASAMVLSPAATTNRLDRLAARGLVRRLPDPGDGRGSIVALSAKGRRLVDTAVEAHVATLQRLLTDLSPRQTADLDRLLARLSAALTPAP